MSLEWRGDEAKRAMARVKRSGALAIATEIVGQAISIVPVKDGNLRNSIQAREDGDGAIVGTNIEYAAFVEYGTRRMSARPYLRPAIDSVRGRAPNIVATEGRQEFDL